MAIVLISQIFPTEQQLPEARVVVQKYFDFLQQQEACQGVELLCDVPGKLYWIERWKNKASMDQCYAQHIVLSDFPMQMISLSREMPVRTPYQTMAKL